ncbi:hypothetical protein H671_3g10536 [Cricetulus griseus]|nr:hypothetical protein H671_3g10536 [Cricetulus griseus]
MATAREGGAIADCSGAGGCGGAPGCSVASEYLVKTSGTAMSALSSWFQKRAMQQALVMHGHAMMLGVKPVLSLLVVLNQTSDLPLTPTQARQCSSHRFLPLAAVCLVLLPQRAPGDESPGEELSGLIRYSVIQILASGFLAARYYCPKMSYDTHSIYD